MDDLGVALFLEISIWDIPINESVNGKNMWNISGPSSPVEAKLPPWTDGNAEVGRVRDKKSRREKVKEEKVRSKIKVGEKVGKSQNNVFFL